MNIMDDVNIISLYRCVCISTKWKYNIHIMVRIWASYVLCPVYQMSDTVTASTSSLTIYWTWQSLQKPPTFLNLVSACSPGATMPQCRVRQTDYHKNTVPDLITYFPIDCWPVPLCPLTPNAKHRNMCPWPVRPAYSNRAIQFSVACKIWNEIFIYWLLGEIAQKRKTNFISSSINFILLYFVCCGSVAAQPPDANNIFHSCRITECVCVMHVSWISICKIN